MMFVRFKQIQTVIVGQRNKLYLFRRSIFICLTNQNLLSSSTHQILCSTGRSNTNNFGKRQKECKNNFTNVVLTKEQFNRFKTGQISVKGKHQDH